MEHNDPINGKTERLYKGQNRRTLIIAMEEGGYTDPRFLTFNQAKEMGRVVRRGQKAAARLPSYHGTGTYPVFNIEQTIIPGQRVVSPEPEVPVNTEAATTEEPDYAAF